MSRGKKGIFSFQAKFFICIYLHFIQPNFIFSCRTCMKSEKAISDMIWAALQKKSSGLEEVKKISWNAADILWNYKKFQ